MQTQTQINDQWQVAGQKREQENQKIEGLLGFNPTMTQLLLVVSGNFGPKNAPKGTKLKNLLQSKPWPVLIELADEVTFLIKTKKCFVDHKGKKHPRNVARLSITKAIAEAGLDLDQVVYVDQKGVEYTRREMILHPFFERRLISGIKANFQLARQNWQVPEWTSIYVRRHGGQKPDLVVELRFDPNFHRKLSSHLPADLLKSSGQKATTKKVEQPEVEQEVEDWPTLPSRPKPVVEAKPVVEEKSDDLEPIPEGASWADY